MLLSGLGALVVVALLVPSLWSSLALPLLIRRFEGTWQLKDTWKGHEIGYTDDMRSILQYGENAIPPLLRFIQKTSSEHAREGAVYTLHLIGIEGKLTGGISEAFRNPKAREALVSLLPSKDLHLLVLSLLARDPWPTDVPHLFKELKNGTPHAWAFVKTLQRYAIHDRPVHQNLPPGGACEIQWEQGLRVEPSWIKMIERSRRRRLDRGGECLQQDDIDELTAFSHGDFGGKVDYFSKEGLITICGVSTAQGRWLDWYDQQQGPFRMGRSTEMIYEAIDGGVDRLRVKLEANPEAATSEHDNGTTALHYAAEYGHADVVRLLLGAGARRNALTDRGESPLDLALKNGHAAVVSELLPGAGGKIVIAAAAGDAREVARLIALDVGLVGYCDSQAFTPLHYAARSGSMETADLLLRNGARADAAGHDGLTPLHEAAGAGQDSLVEILLRRDIDVDARARSLETPLLLASRKGHIRAAELLLEGGASIDARDHCGRTALHRAGPRDDVGMITVLLKKGVSVDARDSQGLTALHHAAAWGWDGTGKMLLDAGAAIDSATNGGATPLHVAARGGKDSMVELLLERGASVNPETSHGETPLFLAALNQEEGTVRRLLEAGAHVDAQDWTGMSALHWAARNGDDKIIILLLSKGAAVNLGDGANWTPLDWSRERDRKAAVVVLEQRGGKANFQHQPTTKAESSITVTTGEDCLEIEIRHNEFKETMERNPLIRSGRLERGDPWRFPNSGQDLLYRTRSCEEPGWGYWKHETVDRADQDLAIRVGR